MDIKECFFNRMPRPNAKIRLICFPFAGGSASVYNNWPAKFQDTIEVVSIQYPGRGNRMKENPIKQLKDLVEHVSGVIQTLCDCGKHMAFYGHSMGSKLVYEITKKMQMTGDKLPFCVFVSGGRAPDIPPRLTMYNLEREEFIYSLGLYKNTPEEILREKDIIDFFIPMLRADFEADETYLDIEHIPLEPPVYVLGGAKDIITSLDDVRAWKRYAKNGYYEKIFPGGHFFIKEQFPEVIEYIQNALNKEFNES